MECWQFESWKLKSFNMFNIFNLIQQQHCYCYMHLFTISLCIIIRFFIWLGEDYIPVFFVFFLITWVTSWFRLVFFYRKYCLKWIMVLVSEGYFTSTRLYSNFIVGFQAPHQGATFDVFIVLQVPLIELKTQTTGPYEFVGCISWSLWNMQPVLLRQFKQVSL